MIGFSYQMLGIQAVTRGLDVAGKRVEGAVAAGMAAGLPAAEGIARGKASGRPGPNVITGAFRQSITGSMLTTGANATAQIGTSAVQGARLENGFYGQDSLGRNYNQPPYPTFGPAAPDVATVMVESVRSAVLAAF